MPTSRRHDLLDSDYSLGRYHNASVNANAVMEDSYDLQSASRGRDHRLLSTMNSALHTDSPPTSPILSRRSKTQSSSQLQHKPRKNIRFDTSGTESYKASKLLDPLKTSRTSDSLKSSKPRDSFRISKQSDPLPTSKLSDSRKTSKMSDSLKSSKQFGSSKLSKISDSLRVSRASESPLRIAKPSSDSLQVSKKYEPRKKTKPAESLELVKLPDSFGKSSKVAGIERISPAVEQAKMFLNSRRTFGKGTEIDNIATTAVTAPRDLKSDFFTVSPLTNYIKNRWPEPEPESELPIPISIEEEPRHKRDLYKNPYIDSDDEDFEQRVVLKPDRQYGEVLQALRRGKKLEFTDDSEDEDETRGAYAIKKYDAEKRSKKYEIEDSPHEMAMSHLVSAAALRARAVLENLTGLYGKGGLVNVEGDIRPYGGDSTTFRLHTPFHFQGPLMVGEKPALSVGDDSFERYMVGLQEKRRDERNKVEKDAKRMTKLTRSLGRDPPKQYSLKPIGYIDDTRYDSFSKAIVPFKTKHDRTIINSSRKPVHFDEDDDDEDLKKPKRTLKLSRELAPYSSDDEMAVVPRRRLPVYEYTEEIPIKLNIQLHSPDGSDPERLSVLEKIRIKALLVGEDKLDDPDRPRIRKPRSKYYADKLQKVDNKEHLSHLMATPTPHTINVRATKVPRKYRLDSRLDPEDLISKPTGYGKMRDQVRDVQDKMDHHRQLMDRHADRAADTGLATGGSLSAGRTAKYKRRGVL